MKLNNGALEIFESPWLKSQVEGHLFFGFFTRQMKLAWLCFVFAIAYSIYEFLLFGKSTGYMLLSDMDVYLFIFIAIIMFQLPKYHQAAISWCAVKFTGAMVSFLLITFSFVKFLQSSPEGPLMLVLGFILFPGIEFIPKAMPYQKLVTMCRVGGSILLGILFVQL